MCLLKTVANRITCLFKTATQDDSETGGNWIRYLRLSFPFSRLILLPHQQQSITFILVRGNYLMH